MQATLPRTTATGVEPVKTEKPARNLAVDTYRGFVMLLMMAEVLQLSRVFRNFPTSRFWSFLAYHQSHVAWAGCSLHDTIQPGFSFLVGVALPYSIASRIAKGGTFGRMFAHAMWRSLLLIALGIFLRSIARRRRTSRSRTRCRRSDSGTRCCSCWRSSRGAGSGSRSG